MYNILAASIKLGEYLSSHPSYKDLANFIKDGSESSNLTDSIGEKMYFQLFCDQLHIYCFNIHSFIESASMHPSFVDLNKYIQNTPTVGKIEKIASDINKEIGLILSVILTNEVFCNDSKKLNSVKFNQYVENLIVSIERTWIFHLLRDITKEYKDKRSDFHEVCSDYEEKRNKIKMAMPYSKSIKRLVMTYNREERKIVNALEMLNLLKYWVSFGVVQGFYFGMSKFDEQKIMNVRTIYSKEKIHPIRIVTAQTDTLQKGWKIRKIEYNNIRGYILPKRTKLFIKNGFTQVVIVGYFYPINDMDIFRSF